MRDNWASHSVHSWWTLFFRLSRWHSSRFSEPVVLFSLILAYTSSTVKLCTWSAFQVIKVIHCLTGVAIYGVFTRSTSFSVPSILGGSTRSGSARGRVAIVNVRHIAAESWWWPLTFGGARSTCKVLLHQPVFLCTGFYLPQGVFACCASCLSWGGALVSRWTVNSWRISSFSKLCAGTNTLSVDTIFTVIRALTWCTNARSWWFIDIFTSLTDSE